jgi:hypothetical protein
MVTDRTKVLLVLPSEVLDQARALAGTATTMLRLTVSVQIVLRALIEEGLKQSGEPALLDSFHRQARAVRAIRRAPRERSRTGTGARSPAGPGHSARADRSPRSRSRP